MPCLPTTTHLLSCTCPPPWCRAILPRRAGRAPRSRGRQPTSAMGSVIMGCRFVYSWRGRTIVEPHYSSYCWATVSGLLYRTAWFVLPPTYRTGQHDYLPHYLTTYPHLPRATSLLACFYRHARRLACCAAPPARRAQRCCLSPATDLAHYFPPPIVLPPPCPAEPPALLGLPGAVPPPPGYHYSELYVDDGELPRRYADVATVLYSIPTLYHSGMTVTPTHLTTLEPSVENLSCLSTSYLSPRRAFTDDVA